LVISADLFTAKVQLTERGRLSTVDLLVLICALEIIFHFITKRASLLMMFIVLGSSPFRSGKSIEIITYTYRERERERERAKMHF
jgi:hypothetical protein